MNDQNLSKEEMQKQFGNELAVLKSLTVVFAEAIPVLMRTAS